MASSNAREECKVYPCCVWSRAGGRQQDLHTADPGAEVWGSIRKHSGKAEGARTVRALLEVWQADCNCTGCIFSVRDCKEKKKKVTFLSHWHPNSFRSCLLRGLLESPAPELERDWTRARRPWCLLAARGCCVDGTHQASQRVSWAGPPIFLSVL